MNVTGFFAVDRGIWDHDLFRSENEPFSKREAWLWLISEAAWKATRRRVKSRSLEVGRGQLVAAFRYLAKRWRWSEAKVRRFVAVLVDEGMVVVESDALTSVITICNYDIYQIAPRESDAHESHQRRTDDAVHDAPSVAQAPHSSTYSGSTFFDGREPRDALDVAPATHSSDQNRRKNREELNKKEVGGGDGPRATLSERSPERKAAHELADEIAILSGHDLDFVPPSWCGAGLRIEGVWFPNGWTRDLVLPIVKDTMRNKRDGPPGSISYFEKPIARALAMAKQPLPEIKLTDLAREKSHGRNGIQTNSPINADPSEILARLERIRQPAPREAGLCDGTSTRADRKISERGGERSRGIHSRNDRSPVLLSERGHQGSDGGFDWVSEKVGLPADNP